MKDGPVQVEAEVKEEPAPGNLKPDDPPSDECIICLEEGAEDPLPCTEIHPYRVHGGCISAFASYNKAVRCPVCGK